MTQENILRQVQNLMRDVFDNSNITITPSTTAKEIEEWDSLNHIQLIVAIEDHFNLSFDLEQMAALENVGDIVTQIHRQC